MRAARLATVVGVCVTAWVTVPATASAAKTQRASVSSAEVQGDGFSQTPAISADGRYVAFQSYSDNLVGGDTNGHGDVFVRDLKTGKTKRVSVSSGGAQADADSSDPSISEDGRFVAFDSPATNLVSGDTNGFTDIFVHDMKTGKTKLVSVSSDGAQADLYSETPSISADGHFVTFESPATNLVSDDTNARRDIFVRNLKAGTTTRVSVSSSGAEADADSYNPVISADGGFVAFYSFATNLVNGDTNGYTDVFVRDLKTGKTKRVSLSSSGVQADSGSSLPSISATGRYVAFESDATNLVKGDKNEVRDIFVNDRRTGKTQRVSVSSTGFQGGVDRVDASISGNGRYVAFDSGAQNLVGGDTNHANDVFVHDRKTGKTRRVSLNSHGKQGNDGSSNPSLSGDGSSIAFQSDASNLVHGDTNDNTDIFVRAPL